MGRPRKSSQTIPTPERILGAAESEFARAGYAAARLEDIAARAGIRRPSLLHHFGSKEALYAATVERATTAMGSALTTAMAVPGDLDARLRSVIEGFDAFARQRPTLARLIIREFVADSGGPGRDVVAERVAPLIDIVVGWADGQRGSAPPRSLRAALVTVAADCLLRASMGELADRLWGEDDLWERVRPMLIRSS